ncbi:metal ABC transporter substrate-binding protein [Calothrix sp. PCC 6303]|uniref:metal ABC transporter substrate-binding protein n=1 Tax=Calothrix sp. PCC 6303 TaxID=1170562 RepID=UPI0002A0423E|nr:metal ABC transporter substrate-binding protein [Calothrix sp. PCC 6303]AFZ03487.1 periplasmic solute binding protein [Calothrix sp. PCC 6303]
MKTNINTSEVRVQKYVSSASANSDNILKNIFKYFRTSTLVTAKSSLIIGIILLVSGLAGCNSTPKTEPETTKVTDTAKKDKKVILTTFTVLADMTKNVAGDKAIVESIVKPGAEIHGYEPTPSDLVRGKKADLILDNGLNLERWAERFYNNIPKVPRVTLSTGIEPVEIGEDAYKGKPNPHAWMSPKNALIYVENIRKALVNLDPINANTYNTNAANYSQKIQAIDQRLKTSVSIIPVEKRYMVSCEGAFSYVTRDYGLKEVYLWAVNSEQQATPRQMEKVIQTVKINKIPAVFCESTVNDKAQREVANATGAKFGGVFYVDSLSTDNGAAPTYLKLIEYNLNILIQGLQKN